MLFLPVLMQALRPPTASQLRAVPPAMISSMKNDVVMIGAPWVEGQNLEGADLAPFAMRECGLADAIDALGLAFTDLGDVDFTPVVGEAGHHYTVDHYRKWSQMSTSDNFATWMKNSGLEQRADCALQTVVEAEPRLNLLNAERMGRGLRLVHDAVQRALDDTREEPPFVLTVGGDHSIASSTIAALQTRYEDLGVIWVDAHADANTPRSSPSGHYHGM